MSVENVPEHLPVLPSGSGGWNDHIERTSSLPSESWNGHIVELVDVLYVRFEPLGRDLPVL